MDGCAVGIFAYAKGLDTDNWNGSVKFLMNTAAYGKIGAATVASIISANESKKHAAFRHLSSGEKYGIF